MRALPFLAVTLALGALGTQAFASEVYRWVDEKGVAHYADMPPSGIKYERVNVRSGSTETISTAQTSDDASAAEADSPAARRAQRCQTARQSLAALQSNLEVSAEFDGKVRPLTAEEREQQVARNQQIVANDCD